MDRIMSNLYRDMENLPLSAPDARADGGIRTIRLAPRNVRIERAVSGVKMRLSIPVEAYQGVVLTCEDVSGRRRFRVTLAHGDPDLSVTLHQATDAPAILMIWQSWARFFSKPALYDEGGNLNEPALHAAPARPRRRNATLTKRRPRILMRRRPARVDHNLKIFAAARELFSRE